MVDAKQDGGGPYGLGVINMSCMLSALSVLW
jgi:hypothetical protein